MNDVATMDSFAGFENLPDGWGVCPLIDLITSTGIMADGDWVESKDQEPGGDVRLIQLADIGDGCFLDRSKRFLTAKKAAQLRCTFLTAGDVLLARMPEPLGRACIFPGSIKPCVTAVDVCIFRSGHDGVDHHWLMHTINSPAIRSKIESLSKGVTRKRISGGNLKQLRVPLPPLNEQRRIAAKIDELFSQLDAGVANLKRARALLEKYRQAVLKTAVTGELTREWRQKRGAPAETGAELLRRILKARREAWEAAELARMRVRTARPTGGRRRNRYKDPHPPAVPNGFEVPEGWALASIDQIGFVESGQTPKGVEEVCSADEDVPWFKVSSMTEPGNEIGLTISKWNLSKRDVARLGFRIQPAGTIVFPKRGGAILTNKKRILKREGTYDLNLMGVVPVDGLGDYLWLYFQFLDLKQIYDGSNVPQINYPDVALLPVGVPPAEERSRIVEEVEQRLSVVDVLLQTIGVLLTQADRLRQGILGAAFSGRLVAQDPHDEPASVLLERVRAERKARTKPARGRRRGAGAGGRQLELPR